MSADPVMSQIFTYFDRQNPTMPHGETGRMGVSWVSRQEESQSLLMNISWSICGPILLF